MRANALALALLGFGMLPLGFAQAANPSAPQYLQTNLVADSTATAKATTIDPNLVGGWGLSESSTGPWWISDNGDGLSTLYNGAGAIVPLVVTVPTADPNKSKTGSPTGIVFNSNASDFLIADGKASTFIFATLDGLIVGWNGAVTANTGQIAVNQSQQSIFTGLAIAPAKIKGVTATYLYAADFKQGTIAVFDANFARVPSIEAAIASIPKPSNYAPFNVQNIGGNLLVTLAEQNATRDDQINGPGKGIVAILSPEGKLINVLETGKFLNAPWGVALAPGNFGAYSHDLLVGNNGNGVIDVFNPATGRFLGKLRDSTGAVIKIDGLWGLSFGNGTVNGGSAISLFFAAAPGAAGGLFGTLTPVANSFGSDN